MKITSGVEMTHASVADRVDFSIWIDDKGRVPKLKAQIRGGKVHEVEVKNGNWNTANLVIKAIPEIRQYINRLR